MKYPVACVLLVDDDNNDNFFHRLTLEEAQITGKIEEANTGVQALEHLRKCKIPTDPFHPKIIFLDINMPVMNGWEFLDEYQHLPATTRKNTILIMLTTSLNPSDRQRAAQNPLVNGFINKPLEQKDIQEILIAHLDRVEG